MVYKSFPCPPHNLTYINVSVNNVSKTLLLKFLTVKKHAHEN